MRIGYCVRGKHANKAKFFAESAAKFGHDAFPYGKNNRKSADILVTYGNFIPALESYQTWINIHASYLGRDSHHRISVGSYHPAYYMMDINRSSDRLEPFDIKLQPWNKSGTKIIVCTVSRENMEIFGLDYDVEVPATIELIKKYTNRPIMMRDRTERFDTPLSDWFPEAWALVTWSSNCAVEALIHGIPCFLRADAAASPMCLTDLSRINNPYYPDNRQQWLQNLAYCQFTTDEIRNGTAWHTVMYSFLPRGMILR